MSLDSQTIRSEPHVEIGDLIQRSVGIVTERWSHRAVQEQPNAKRVHHAVLRDHLQDVLWTLGHSLAAADEAETSLHCLPATAHGEQRWETGWSLVEVVRDFQILRVVLLEFLEESLDRPLHYREVQAIGVALDDVIAASVVMYVKGRDQHLQEAEAQRAAADKRFQELLLKQAESLRIADRRKNEFLAILAHELRNPLAPIRNAAEIVRLQSAPNHDLEWAGDVIARQLEQLTHIVDDLVDVSRIARGKIQLRPESVDILWIVNRAIETVRPLLTSRNQELSVAIPDGPVRVQADPSRLTQVLVNLLANSVKYTDDGGHIWIAVEPTVGQVAIRVRDNGLGISAELLPSVFELFMQEERSQNLARGGLGIGLSLVRSLVELHGGTVQAHSAGPGQGSEFVVRLPVPSDMPGERVDRDKTPTASGAVSARRILVVDDDVDNADSLALLLRVIGHHVDVAYDGPTALETAHAQRPDLVFLDIGLPGMDGLETARRMRQTLGSANVTLVALTGYAQQHDKHRSHEAGFDAHLLKPLDFNELQIWLANAALPQPERPRPPTE
jgi:signal transduction histidine kinase/ActR/RegA family two-component response regulator